MAAPQEDSVVSRRSIIDTGQTYFYSRLIHTHGPTVELLVPGIYARSQKATHQRGDRRGCLRGTRGTILEAIESWSKDPSMPPIFWLDGLTGTGKSAIAQTVAGLCDAHDKLVSSFFCSRDDADHHSLCLIFPTLAIQLAQQHPKIWSILLPLLRSNPDIVYESLSKQVKKLIVEPLMSADVPAIIVIDALDEWLDDTSQSALLSAVEYWARKIPKVKFLITSRPEPHILAGFCLPLLCGLADALTLHDVAPDLINNDIRIFLEHELSGLAAQSGLDDWPTAAQLDLLCGRVAGLFVYAVATVKFLGQKHTSPDKQYAIVAHSPDDTVHEGTVEGVHGGMSLDSLCISILRAPFKDNNAQDDAVVRSVLAAVVLVTHPLPPYAIADLICLTAGVVMNILGSIQSLLRLHEDPDEPVCPFHKLLSDLLTSPTRCVDERFYIAPWKSHSEITLNCLKLMNEGLGDSVSLHDAINPRVALKYACTSWHVHLTEIREDVTAVIPALRHFLEEQFIAWLKELGAVDAAADPVLALNKTISWLREVRSGSLWKSRQRLHQIR